jgi:hypothetical protein
LDHEKRGGNRDMYARWHFPAGALTPLALANSAWLRRAAFRIPSVARSSAKAMSMLSTIVVPESARGNLRFAVRAKLDNA